MIGNRIIGGIEPCVSQEEREEIAERQARLDGEQPLSLVALFAILCVVTAVGGLLTWGYFAGPKTIENFLVAFLVDGFVVFVLCAFCSRMREGKKK
jgi:hypothetical protein